MSSAQPPNSQTRHQLDELDALLQRMLALPLAGREEGNAPQPVVDAAIPLPPTRTNFADPIVRPMPPTQAPEPGEPAVQGWRVEFPRAPETPPAEAADNLASHLEPNAPAAATPALPAPMIFGQPSAGGPTPGDLTARPAAFERSFSPPAIPAASLSSRSAAAQPPVPALLWPVLALNWVFDSIVCLFGPLGRWLTYPHVRNAMGWLGVLMTLSAIGWAVGEWYGFDWTP
jgi:hypothetical protein